MGGANIGVGTRGAPGARAPQVFSLFHIYPVLQMKFYILCPPNQKVFPTPLANEVHNDDNNLKNKDHIKPSQNFLTL